MVAIGLVTNPEIDAALANTLRYYALFRYPLTINEIARQCSAMCTLTDIHSYLSEQISCQKLYFFKGYYILLANVEELVARREAGAWRAGIEIVKAKRAGLLIARFPFVQFVGISGSLSKNYADEQTDYDFFIITSAKRLWICRTLLHLFKKSTFITGSHHHFCMNYFVDESQLEIKEQNIYTATELTSLIPVNGEQAYHNLLSCNDWIYNQLPNHPGISLSAFPTARKLSLVKRCLEQIINVLAPEIVNRQLMKLTDKWWQRKWAKKKYPALDYPLAFKTTEHVSKNHPANYQKKILDQLKPVTC